MEIGFNVENEPFSKVAEWHGVESRKFWEEIRNALEAARQSKAPAARAFWASVPQDATAVDVLRRIVEMV